MEKYIAGEKELRLQLLHLFSIFLPNGMQIHQLNQLLDDVFKLIVKATEEKEDRK